MSRRRIIPLARRLAALALLAVGASLAAGSHAIWEANAQENAQARPQRIVSLNLCTDELLMQLVEPERIASITFLSRAPGAAPSEAQPLIARLHANRGLAEEVLMLKPDLVLVGAYSARQTTDLLKKLGFRVVEFSPDSSFDDVRASIRKMGEAVGEPRRAEDMIIAFDTRLARLVARIPAGEAPVYADLGVNNWMAGAGTLTAAIANAAGYVTLGQSLGHQGYGNIPLEQLVRLRPDVVSTPTQWTRPPSISTDALRHPALKTMMAGAREIRIPDRYWVCGSPYTLDAVERLIETRRDIAGLPK